MPIIDASSLSVRNLSEEQRLDYIPEPTQFIAEAVRTSYDKTNLKGQGFIYVAPDSGHFRPKGLKMADQPWSFQNGILLERILLHELGHVFGLSHSGNTYDLMGQDQPEYIVQKSTIERMSKENPELLEKALTEIGIFGFKFPYEREFCQLDSVIDLKKSDPNTDQFFGFSGDSKCHKFVFLQNSIEVYAAAKKGDAYQLVGKTLYTPPVLELHQSLTRIKLNKLQKAFARVTADTLATGYMEGPGTVTKKTFLTTYETINGQNSGSIKTTFLPNQLMEMEVVMDGKLIEVFN